DQVANQNLMNQRERFREKILVKIMEVIDRRAREQGFALLHNTSSEDIFRNPVIVFQQNLPDLTKEVLAELNAGR
ncbi:MAG TPA: OmpH family outer membrane protein, partial [Verrucomicrobia bacterium]|nr:OmpH family outer membrane protein [Verrucomicrobiota bacterium]